MPSTGLRAAFGLALLTACATSGRGPGLEPRFLAVHNALAAMGLAQVGSIHEGTLGEGQEARAALELTAGCTTIVALGGDGLRDLDAQLLDAQGKPLAHDTTTEPQASLRTCLEAAGTYVLVLHASAGGGTWVAAAWQGGAGATAGPIAAPAPSAHQAMGTCESPFPLSPGTVSGSTTRGEDASTGSCERSDAREIVYQLDVTQRQRVTLEVEAHFDSVLYIRKEACTDSDAEIDCNDDAPNGGRNRSRIERVLEPGKYFIFVDGYNQEAGSYKLTLTTSDVVSLLDVCRRGRALPAGVAVTGSTTGSPDDAEASCGGGAQGAEAAWRMDLAARSRVRVVEHSDDVTPVVHVRRACTDEQSEIACGEPRGIPGDAAVTGVLEAGAYTVFADARERDSAGGYSLLLETAPPAGSGIAGDGCGDALPLGTPSSVPGDTFAARDDVAGSCGGAGAADVVYRLDVAHRSRLSARLESEDAPHVLSAWSRCGDRAGELACGRTIDDVVSPGTYFIAVDGTSPDALGRFTLAWTLQDLSAQTAACAAAPTLASGRTTASSSAGQGDRFATSCSAGGDATMTGPDRVFRFSLASRSKVHLALTASFEATLELRKACADLAATGAVLTCEADADSTKHLTLDRTLEPGTYWVVVDGQTPNDQGPFTLDYRIVSAR